MLKFRKRPVVIDAFKLGEKGQPTPAPAWFGTPDKDKITPEGILIQTLEGEMLARWGDYIIKGIQGEIYPCKPDIFEQSYERVTDES